MVRQILRASQRLVAGQQGRAADRKQLIGHYPVGAQARPIAAAIADRGIDIAALEIDERGRRGDVDVDVKIESMEANDRISLVGQVLSNTEKFFDNTPVKLESHGTVRYKTMTNFVGEFAFDEVPKDTYHLSVDLPEGQITLFCVHRGNS